MSDDPAAPEQAGQREPFRFLDHWGMISGVTFGFLALGLLILLAVAGDPGALAILVVLGAGVLLIFLFGQMHGARGH
ncbi:MAG: hypothetical protein ACRD0Z_02885 [Acidimicrobiales bacterium]